MTIIAVLFILYQLSINYFLLQTLSIFESVFIGSVLIGIFILLLYLKFKIISLDKSISFGQLIKSRFIFNDKWNIISYISTLVYIIYPFGFVVFFGSELGFIPFGNLIIGFILNWFLQIYIFYKVFKMIISLNLKSYNSGEILLESIIYICIIIMGLYPLGLSLGVPIL